MSISDKFKNIIVKIIWYFLKFLYCFLAIEWFYLNFYGVCSMKRYVYALLIMFVFSTFMYAQSKFKYLDANMISVGGGTTLTTDLYGGFFDIGMNIYTYRAFSVRNYIEINGGGYGSGDVGGGYFGVRERIIIGQIMPITDLVAARGYGGFDIGFAFYSGSGKDSIFEAPFILETRGFGGVEFLFDKEDGGMSAVFIEAGGGGRLFIGGEKLENSLISHGAVFINFGGRYYFN